MDFNFNMPVKVVCGKHCVTQHSSLLCGFGNKALLITGKHSAKACGALKDVQKALKTEGIAYALFDKVSANPLLSTCYEAGAAAKAEGADFIIAIGGGSVLDAAKAAAIAATNSFEKPEGIFRKAFDHAPLPLVVIGTTAGTGSEVSPTAVITVDAIMEKRSITGESCFAKLALCDARYTLSLNREITVSTALDAFAHATEGWFSKKRNTAVEIFAARCLPDTFEILRALAAGAELSEEQRETMYYCSLFAGMILCIGTTFPHLLGYTLTDKRGVPHGQACAVFDKELIAWCTKHAPAEAAPYFKLLESDYYEVMTVLEALIAIPEDVHFSAAEIETYSKKWTDDNPKLQNVCGHFTRKDALEIFTRLFGEKSV